MLRTIGERLEWLREVADDMSQSRLAQLAGLARSHVQQIEAGTIPDPQRSTLRALSETTGTSIDWLSEGKGKPPDPESVCTAVRWAGSIVDAPGAGRAGQK